MPNHPHRDSIIVKIQGALPSGSAGDAEARAAFAFATLNQSRTSTFEAMAPNVAAAALSEAWDFVRSVAGLYNVDVDEKHIAECIASYDHWLSKRAT